MPHATPTPSVQLALAADNAALSRRARLMEMELQRQAHLLNERSEFMAQMSHELRTPLNGVIGMAQLLIGTPLNSEQEEIVQMLAQSAENLLGLVNDVLDFSKIEAGALTLEATPFDLGLLVESVLDLVSRGAAEKGLYLTYVPDARMPDRFIGDPTRIRQVLLNLVSNALKFTFDGEIIVRARSEQLSGSSPECRLHLSVSDTGIGIPHDRLGAIFEPYAQADSSTSRRFGGTGLGLAIVRRLASLMRGEVAVSSQPHHGSIFAFSAQLLAASPAYARTPRFDGARVLVADAHAPTLDMLSTLLSRTGAHVLPATTTDEALRALDSGAVNAALYSANLSDTHGTRLLVRARQHAFGAHLPAIEYHPLGQRPAGTTVRTLTTPIHRDALYKAVGELLDGASDEGTQSEGATPGIGLGAPLRILLAEDNPINQMVALRLLESLGYRADVVENGLEAVEAVQRHTYDVVLMDIMMPVMDGLEATRRIRQANLARSPRIIAVTANALAGDRQRCLEAGMDEHLPKPLRVDALAQALKQITPEPAPAAPVPDPDSPLDRETLRTLRASVGEEDLAFFDELLTDFLADSHQLLADLDAALATGDAASARRAVHTLKSSAAMFGAHPLSQQARVAEDAAKAGDLDAVQTMAPALHTLFGEVEAAVESMRAGGLENL